MLLYPISRFTIVTSAVFLGEQDNILLESKSAVQAGSSSSSRPAVLEVVEM